jgi:hypothetical protein
MRDQAECIDEGYAVSWAHATVEKERSMQAMMNPTVVSVAVVVADVSRSRTCDGRTFEMALAASYIFSMT